MKNLMEIEINLENLSQNIKNLKSLIKPQTQFMAVVKANAYGHGLIETSKAAIEAGADWLGVVNIDEAVGLREAGVHKPILILGAVQNDDLRTAANKDVSVALFSITKIREVAEINFDRPLKVHLKIDTGMNRLGLEVEEIPEAVRILSGHRNIIIEGVYSHLASLRENDQAFTKAQIDNFKKALKTLKELGFDQIYKHLAATSATLVMPETHFDLVRCGLSVYGLWPSDPIREHAKNKDLLTPVLSFKTQIVQIKPLKKGEKVGYGCTYEAKKDIIIGIIPVGYADGLDRGLSNCGEVLVGGTRCPIIGRVCMNMAIVDISTINPKSELQISNDIEVTIIGKQGEEEITVDEIAQKLGTINHEVIARLPEHIHRIYL